MTVTHFAILEDKGGEVLCLHLRGELDIASVPALEERLTDLRVQASGQTIRLDLAELEFIDSTGLHALIRAMNDASANGWRLQIDREMSPQVERVLRLVGIERLIGGFDSDGQ
jgi:anti-anti-sigma factor